MLENCASSFYKIFCLQWFSKGSLSRLVHYLNDRFLLKSVTRMRSNSLEIQNIFSILLIVFPQYPPILSKYPKPTIKSLKLSFKTKSLVLRGRDQNEAIRSRRILWAVLDHFMGLVLKGLKYLKMIRCGKCFCLSGKIVFLLL